MIEFMVLGAPRSGTAWAANWLTTERTLCLHDVLFDCDLDDVDKVPCDRKLGVADTGLGLFPDWVKKHPARKVVLRRDLRQINKSLREAGLQEIQAEWYRRLYNLTGPEVMHVEWNVLFEGPEIIHHHLFGNSIPFDGARHALLARLNVQVDFEKVDPDPLVARKMILRVQRALRQ